MNIKIDKDVPLPTNVSSGTVYPFAEMEVNDSFFVAGKTSNQMVNAAAHWRKAKGWGFVCRNVVENDVKGARVWRVK